MGSTDSLASGRGHGWTCPAPVSEPALVETLATAAQAFVMEHFGEAQARALLLKALGRIDSANISLGR